MNSNETNLHHGVPRSFTGGNDSSINLTRVQESEHAAFHQMAGHLPPDFFIRRFLLSTIGWKNKWGHSVPSEYYVDAFRLLMHEDWQTLYKNGTFRPEGNDSSLHNLFAKASIHVYNTICDEQYATSECIDVVLKKKYVSPSLAETRRRSFKFFKTHDPIAVVHSFVTEENTDGYKWVKPLKNEVRNSIKDVSNVFLQPSASADTSLLKNLLQEHRTKLRNCFEEWDPQLKKHLPYIREHQHDSHSFRMFLHQYQKRSLAG